MQIHIKRIYDPPADDDGLRVLIDRLWPRGLRKDDAQLDLWAKDIAPSTELRQWYDHDPRQYPELRKRYMNELAGRPAAVDDLLAAIREADTVTLLYASKDTVNNHAFLLREFLMARLD